MGGYQYYSHVFIFPVRKLTSMTKSKDILWVNWSHFRFPNDNVQISEFWYHTLLCELWVLHRVCHTNHNMNFKFKFKTGHVFSGVPRFNWITYVLKHACENVVSGKSSVIEKYIVPKQTLTKTKSMGRVGSVYLHCWYSIRNTGNWISRNASYPAE